jgi:hypothetical protein
MRKQRVFKEDSKPTDQNVGNLCPNEDYGDVVELELERGCINSLDNTISLEIDPKRASIGVDQPDRLSMNEFRFDNA